MGSEHQARRVPVLERLHPAAEPDFATPVKKINDGDDLDFFLSSVAYHDLTVWLLQLNRSMFPTIDRNGTVQPSTLDLPPSYSEAILDIRSLLGALSQLVEQAPPSTGPRRFGNVAFRDWCRLAEEQSESLLRTHLASILTRHGHHAEAVLKELKLYLLGSFGSAQRLDYGTGHELSFIAFLGGLWKLGAFENGEERAIVTGVIQPYLELVRRLIMTYTLEPAGSHGVWGLDDHCFVPYIFGSAQIGPAIDATNYATPVPTEGSLPSAPPASAVAKKDVVAEYKDSNMYFSAIQFIYDVKKGPFWEHSPILFDISGIKDGWAKINKGMLKMYAAEVLGKFPVVQHFPFGGLFRWEKDPDAVTSPSVHRQQQPAATHRRAVPSAPDSGTAAPWANSPDPGVGTAPAQGSAGTPSTRAPWAAGGAGGNAQPATSAPWAAAQRAPPRGGTTMPPPTAAPWARKDHHK